MPFFDFECKACGKVTEILVRSGDTKHRCSSCNSLKLKKMISAPSIITKSKSSGSSSKSSCTKSSCAGCSCHCH